MNTFKTKAGTELPVLDLKGKPYLQAAYRILWFREEHPDWLIKVEFIRLEESYCVAKAEVFDTDLKLRAVAHKREDKKDFMDFMEKAETGAIGRALAMIGYGTQFTGDELNEGSRIVDSPVSRPTKSIKKIHDEIPPPSDEDFQGDASESVYDAQGEVLNDPGMIRLHAAKKYIGKLICDIPTNDLMSYLAFWKKSDTKVTGPLLKELQLIEEYIRLAK